MRKKDNKQINFLTVLMVFILGVLIASNVFCFIYISQLKQSLSGINHEIEKLKADDMALAQTINNLYTKLEAVGLINK